jgi:hypothetical protein
MNHIELVNYFYSEEVIEKTRQIRDFVPKNHRVVVFPEATMKKNQMPNGLLIRSPMHNSMIMPALLRDPGCGFFIFKLILHDTKHQEALANEVMNYCIRLENEITHNCPLSEDNLLFGVSQETIKNKDIFPTCRLTWTQTICI